MSSVWFKYTIDGFTKPLMDLLRLTKDKILIVNNTKIVDNAINKAIGSVI